MKTNCGMLWTAALAVSCAIVLLQASVASARADRQLRTRSYDEAYWFDPAHDLTLSVVLPRAKRQASTNAINEMTPLYNAADFGCSNDAVAWCKQQGGEVSYQQYSYVSGPGVVAFGRKRAFCNLGQYTLTEVETLASPYLTLAQMAYVYPLPNFEWNRTQWGNPASQYCAESNGATVSVMYVPSANTCVGTGWSTLPAESSPGLSNSCEFADGSSIDAWALFNGQAKSTAKRITPYFRAQASGQSCM